VNETEFSLRLIEGGLFYVSRNKIYCSSPNPTKQVKILSGKGAEFVCVDNELPKKGCQTYNTSTLKVLRVSLINWVGGHCWSDHYPLLLSVTGPTTSIAICSQTLVTGGKGLSGALIEP
jgi:hypothetical protein